MNPTHPGGHERWSLQVVSRDFRGINGAIRRAPFIPRSLDTTFHRKLACHSFSLSAVGSPARSRQRRADNPFIGWQSMKSQTENHGTIDDTYQKDNLHDNSKTLPCLKDIEESPTSATASYAEEVAVPVEQMRQRLAHDPGKAIFGAFVNGELIAMAGFKRELVLKARHRGDIWGVYVAPTARGTGVSGKLLIALLDYVRTLPGVILVNLCVRTTNDAANALYQRLGFVVTGINRRSIFAEGAYHDEQRMQLDLDAG